MIVCKRIFCFVKLKTKIRNALNYANSLMRGALKELIQSLLEKLITEVQVHPISGAETGERGYSSSIFLLHHPNILDFFLPRLINTEKTEVRCSGLINTKNKGHLSHGSCPLPISSGLVPTLDQLASLPCSKLLIFGLYRQDIPQCSRSFGTTASQSQSLQNI